MGKTASSKKLYFKNVPQVGYEGPGTDNPFAFQWYDEKKKLGKKTMKDHLRFACAYWHSFCGSGADPFGEPTHLFPWNESPDPLERARAKADAAFEFMSKLGLPYYCFHDVDAVDYGSDVKDNEQRLRSISNYLLEKQKSTGIKLLWGTATFQHSGIRSLEFT